MYFLVFKLGSDGLEGPISEHFDKPDPSLENVGFPAAILIMCFAVIGKAWEVLLIKCTETD